jgi:hypothetical protein
LESKLFVIVTILFTLYQLFVNDIIGASGAPKTNPLYLTIGSVDVLVFCIFLAEMSLNIVAFRKVYVLNVLFVLDAVSLLS